MRCRYSAEGKEVRRPKNPDRCGEFLGYTRKEVAGTLARIRWDNNKTIYTIAPSFIEIYDA